MAPGERTVLRSVDPQLDLRGNDDGRFQGGQDRFDVLELRAADRLEPSPAVPDRLATMDRPAASDAAATRSFELGSNRINGRQMDMARIDEVIPAGTTEVWSVTNGHDLPHSFHPHLIHFVVLDIDGEPPPPHLSGWKDTIYVAPGRTVRIAARFDGVADPSTPFMYHCHILRHEDNGMMGQYVVVEPGQEAEPPSGGHAGHDGG